MGFRSVPADNFVCRPSHLIGKEYMLITAEDPAGAINTMTAGWGGLGFIWGVPAAFVFIRPQRYTKHFVDTSEHFSLCFFDATYRKTLGYLGTVSGRDEDKIARSGLTIMFEDNVPMFAEASIVMLATKMYAQDMRESCFTDPEIPIRWYPEKDYHTMYVGRIDSVLEKT